MPCRRAIQSIHVRPSVRRVRVVGSVTIPPVRSAATATAVAVRVRPPTTRRIFPLTGQGQRTRAEGGSIGCHAGVTCLESSRQATPRWAEAADHHVLSAALPAICTEPLERGGDGDVTGSQLPSSACYTTPRAVQLQGQGEPRMPTSTARRAMPVPSRMLLYPRTARYPQPKRGARTNGIRSRYDRAY